MESISIPLEELLSLILVGIITLHGVYVLILPLSSLDMLSALTLSLNSFSVYSTNWFLLPYSLTLFDLSLGVVSGPDLS
ncbi:hypothetical protein VNO77_39547 [Canavalia gladiata]|uniref:Uncharacterized protein n=1 Tax=Canavalia gladiata TaxID=3824 RepID=A0AAN9PRF8_CANGL